jgi:uncharacterized protein YuzE
VTTIRLNDDVVVDLGVGEEVVGIEVMDDSHHPGIDPTVPRVALENLGQHST